MDVKQAARAKAKKLADSLGYRSCGPVLVIESDDWGATRVPSAEALDDFAGRHPEFRPDHYQRLDALDSYDDVASLRGVLLGVSNAAGEHPKVTMNFAMANPDFGAIRDNGFSRFEYEPLQTSYRRGGAGKTTLDALREASSSGVLRPQLHAREHLNATSWLSDVRGGGASRDAFDLGMVGVGGAEYCAMDALNPLNADVDRVAYLAEAAALFEATFGFSSKSFIASCYVWDGEVERILRALGISQIQSGRFQRAPRRDGSLARRLRSMGSTTRCGQVLTVRNCNFETARWKDEGLSRAEIVERGVREVEEAFALRHPAVVCSHRVNYVSAVSPENAELGRGCLAEMLERVTEAHPDVRFLFSDELGDEIRGARR